MKYVIGECIFKELQLKSQDEKMTEYTKKYMGTYKCLGFAKIGSARFEIFEKNIDGIGTVLLYHNGKKFLGTVITKSSV